jgi:GNAT superfamily N-acetyltransferase
MTVEFVPITGRQPGLLAALLRASYSELVQAEPQWAREQMNWEGYDREVFACPDSVGACLFLTRLEGRIAGFASWDARQRPAYIIGHNCILPEFRRKGLGRQQIEEMLRRFCRLDARKARVSTNDHPLFAPAQRLYLACGFQEVQRTNWDRDPRRKIIEYEKNLAVAVGGDR